MHGTVIGLAEKYPDLFALHGKLVEVPEDPTPPGWASGQWLASVPGKAARADLEVLVGAMRLGMVRLYATKEGEVEIVADPTWRKAHPKYFAHVYAIVWDTAYEEVRKHLVPLLPTLGR